MAIEPVLDTEAVVDGDVRCLLDKEFNCGVMLARVGRTSANAVDDALSDRGVTAWP